MTEDFATLLGRAAQLFDRGPLGDAIVAHHELLAAYPNVPAAWYNLALLERRSRHFAESIVALDEALARGITNPEEVWLQRGVVLSDDLGDSNGARKALDRAIALAPRYVPALLNLGNLEEDLGQREAAQARYRDALAADPDNPLALSRLAGVASLAGPGDPVLDALRDGIARADHDLARADLGFALGAALDRLGEYDIAFDAYLDANRFSRRYAASRSTRYDRAAWDRWGERLIESHPPAASDGAGDAPIFVCGMVRSGSTLAERMLARHSALAAGGELGAILAISTDIGGYPEAIAQLTDYQRAALVARYRTETGPFRIPGRRLIDKRPDNILHLCLIRALFPDAMIVRTVRAPIDNVLSAFFLHADPMLAYATDLNDIAHHLALQDHIAAKTVGTLRTLDYDRLVADPRGEMAALLGDLGLAWEEGVLDPTRGGGAVRTASVWQVREPVHRRSSGRWRHYAHRLGSLPERLGAV